MPRISEVYRCRGDTGELFAFQHELLSPGPHGQQGIPQIAGLGNSLPQNGPRALLVELCNKRFVEQCGAETGRDKGMLTPEDALLLTVMQRQRRRIELQTLRNEADTRDRAEELQAQLDELDTDYDQILQAAVLI